MELEQRVKLARLILALAEDDREAVVAAYTAMGVRTKNMGESHTGKNIRFAQHTRRLRVARAANGSKTAHLSFGQGYRERNQLLSIVTKN